MIKLTGTSPSGDILTAEADGVQAAWVYGRGMVRLGDGTGFAEAFIDALELEPQNEEFETEGEMWEWLAQYAGESWKGAYAGPGMPTPVTDEDLERALNVVAPE